MKNILNMILIIGLLIGLGAFLQGCMLFGGHGNDADPFTEGDTQIQSWDDAFGSEPEPSPSLQSKYAAHDTANDSLLIVGEVLRSIGFQIAEISLRQVKTINGANKAWVRHPPAFTHDSISLTRSDGQGGTAQITGECITVREERKQCAVFADLTINYSSYTRTDGTTISGSEDAKIIATSYACAYHKNMHVDYKMMGNLDVDNVTIRELEFTADYHSQSGGEIVIESAVVDTVADYRYCYHGPLDETECTPTDGRPLDDFCSSSDDVCQVSAAGHASCAEAMPTGDDGHCNLGCCTPLPAEANTCNGAWTNRRECDPAVDTLFTARYVFRPTTIHDYETYLVCTPDGLWSPPCIPSSPDNICPFGSTCIASDSINWGGDFGDYGYCSCTGEELN